MVIDNFKPWPGWALSTGNVLWGLEMGSGACMLGDFLVGEEVDCLVKLWQERKEQLRGKSVEPESRVAHPWESPDGESGKWALHRFKTGSS